MLYDNINATDENSDPHGSRNSPSNRYREGAPDLYCSIKSIFPQYGSFTAEAWFARVTMRMALRPLECSIEIVEGSRKARGDSLEIYRCTDGYICSTSRERKQLQREE